MKTLFLTIFAIFLGVFLLTKEILDTDRDEFQKEYSFYNKKFENLAKVEPMRAKPMIKSMFKFYKDSKKRLPKEEIPICKVKSDFYKSDSNISIRWLGHSSNLIVLDSKVILTDPMLSDRASPVAFAGPKKYSNEPIDAKDFDFVDLILISHNHYDHLDKKTIKTLKDKTEHFITPLGVKKTLVKWGVDKQKVSELNWYENLCFDGIDIVFTPTKHFSSRGLSDRDRTLWGSYVIKNSKYSIFFSGDSGYFDGFKEIGRRYGGFDFTLIESGAYNEAWAGMHMFPKQSVKAHLDLKGKYMIPIHWAKFDLALHSWSEPISIISKLAKENQIELITPKIGEAVTFNNLPKEKWWEVI